MIQLEELEDSVWENPGQRLTEERYLWLKGVARMLFPTDNQ